MELWTAFVIGLVGSTHCVGMCGPIALALPYNSRRRAVGNVLLYNAGRISTYALIGAVLGLVGQGLLVAGLQKGLSIGLGLGLLLAALLSINVESQLQRLGPLRRLNGFVKRGLGRLVRSDKASAMFAIGLLNGLLPCGLVYMAVLGAISTGVIWQGMAYMAAFGLGTVPLMASVAGAGQFIRPAWRRHLQRLMPVWLLLFAVLLLWRGIRFYMPADFLLWHDASQIPECH